MSTLLTLGFSPCPNDCFIFDAMIHGKIDTEDLVFDVTMTDVENLNKKAFEGTIDITKLSYHAYAYLTDKYALLNSGSALGKGCGPLLISKFQVSNLKSQISNLKIAIPGKYTTANLLFSLAYPNAKNKVEMVFSEIEDAVLNGRVDAGVIIHENRFTYEAKGLKKIIDLGEYWEQHTQYPIPLGGIVVNRRIDKPIQQKINRVLRKSIEYAFANPADSRAFVKANAQEMSDEVIQKHIDLYVNNYTIELGKEGKKAIHLLFEEIKKLGIVPNTNLIPHFIIE
ncbi:MAG: 1,4-dihydroxy-6-naphthoate synthase [Bacteroidetes bacterium]|nr:1,4-dihydroxy-6-naphthoate synthase [Bacteroidota bacterium]